MRDFRSAALRRQGAVLFAATVFLAAASTVAAAQSCRQTAGPERASELVQQCIEVSPATHPPCNAENPCGLISGEIERSCLMLGAGDHIPPFCGKYRRPS